MDRLMINNRALRLRFIDNFIAFICLIIIVIFITSEQVWPANHLADQRGADSIGLLAI